MPVTLRAYLRYVVPLTLLSALACLPLVWLAARVGAAPDLAKARAQVRLGWILAGCAWICQLWLVAGVAPAVRGVVCGQPLSQWRALADGARGLVHGLVPSAIAICAIALGGVALVVPGLLLLVLLAFTGASERLAEPPPAALVDSAAAARKSFSRAALLVATVIAVDLAVAFVAQSLLVPTIAKKVPAAQLLPIRTFVRTVPLALAALSPLLACALAAGHARFTRRAS